MRYFDHDTHAADDDAIMALRLEHGGAAVDAYWTLLELMYRDEAPICLAEKPKANQGGNQVGSNVVTKSVSKSVSHRLCIGSETLFSYVSTMLEVGLFEGSLECLTSARAMRNIQNYQARVETARQNGKKGGRKTKKKPNPNQVGSKSVTKSVPSGLQEKKRKYIGSYKEEPIYIGGEVGAAAVKTAPPSPRCAECGTELTETGMQDPEAWYCDGCNQFIPQSKISA